MNSTNNRRKRAVLLWAALMLSVTPFAAVAGMQAQGMQAQGMQAQGMQAQGMQAQGMQAQGMQAQGMQAQGMQAQGMQAQGMQAQGMQAQGMQAQGMQAQGVAVIGNDVAFAEYKGVTIGSVEMRGLTPGSTIQAHALTNIPNMSAGPGNYISVGGGKADGHYGVAHLLDPQGNAAEDLDLFFAGSQKDPVPNLFHRFEEQDNEDELYIVYFFHKWSGQWMSLCPYNAATQSASAMPIAEDPANPNKFILACTATGVDSKCARGWGFRPWAETQAWVFDPTADGGLGAWGLQSFDLKPYYDVCTNAARAAYCQDDRSYTKNGTLVDLFDTRQIIWPNAIENPFSAANDPTSLWMIAQEYFISTGPSPLLSSIKDSALQRTRYRELSPTAECGNIPYIDRLEHDHIEDGRWASPLTNTPRIQVFSPTYCTHNEHEVGGAVLPWDCSPCTTQVCKTMPECCGANGGTSWTLACKGQADAVCRDGAVPWPAGKVWPRDLPVSTSAVLPKFLLGPAGAVARVDGTSGSGTSATVSGWACDPEWPGATVAVQVYGGGPRDEGGTLLGTVRADQALAAPLAREVAAACDGPDRTAARHGFSATLPLDQAGNVFVYAIDEATADGPAAPPTLIRNGIVHVPRCAHSEHEAGAALAETCSTCAASVCGDGTHASCCTTAWTDDCAAAADACTPANSSAAANSHTFAAVTTGWIEAPSTGAYTFEASQQPSRLYINGATVLDWFETSPGTTSGTITLAAGQRYALRWDRLQAEPPSGTPGPGLTWQPPGTIGQTAIPAGNLYEIVPGSGAGLTATYFTSPGFVGAALTRRDPNVDINHDIAPPGPPPLDLPSGYTAPYSARWEGELIPSFTENYSFYVIGSGSPQLFINGAAVAFPPPSPSSAPGGCAHDLCQTGDKLDASCNTCVQAICDKDPYCCDGGYLSYYSVEPVWDAKCIAEVAKYCAPSRCDMTTLPLPLGVSPQTKSAAVPLQAGVHYTIRFDYNNPTTDKTVRLLWASERQAKLAIPQFALFPKDAVATGKGAGLNLAVFATTSGGGGALKADFTKALAAGSIADLSITPTIGQLGLPLVDVLASPVDASSGQPAQPVLVRPRYGEEVFVDGGMTTHVTGIGGITGGWIHITVGGTDMLVAVGADGHFEADVPVALGAQNLKLVQQTYSVSPCVAPLCAVSKDVIWPITVTPATAPGTAPVILSPTDPTHTGVAAPLAVSVVGSGSTGPVHIQDQAPIIPVNFTPITPASDGTFSGSVTLDPGTPTDPLKGFHKLVFDQGGPASRPVFVSVGIDPPTVEFPRNGAELDCSQDDDDSPPPARGTVPYTADQLGELQVFEETGREALGFIGTQARLIPPVNPGDPIRFEAFYNPGPGKHLLVFFQAPPVPAGENPDRFLRAFSNIADTPTSRVVVNIPPRRFQYDPGLAQVLRPQQPFIIQSSTDCSPPPAQNGPGLHCALPFADVNVRVGARLYTTRANNRGGWHLEIFDVPPHGWNDVTVSQVTDSNVGGAWSESCPSNTIEVGYESLNGTFIEAPPDMQVNATGPAGAVVTYDVKARDAANRPVPVTCVPPSGSTFPVGTTFVHCTAPDGPDGGLALGGFLITVVDPGPTLKVFDMVLEADQPTGTEVTVYPIVASDVVDQNLFIQCVPPVPNFFLLDESTPVACEVRNRFNQHVDGVFTVNVVDTQAPVLCPLSDIKIGSNSGAGAIVNYATCAKDVVDGDVTPDCGPHPPGSFFPFGDTKVKCTATDAHGNSSSATFTVSVGDTTPPVLTVPTVVTAIATSKNGAKVSYSVSAVDNIDPHPTVKCVPPSGSQFPLGKTPVTCTATDASGNASQKTFMVKVIVSWSGLLPPIPTDGSGVFQRGSTIPVKFTLTGASANICDLTARLYIAPLDAAGNPGTEKPAPSRPPGTGNTFAVTGSDYHLNLDTSKMAVGPWQLRVDLGDGEPHPTRITLR